MIRSEESVGLSGIWLHQHKPFQGGLIVFWFALLTLHLFALVQGRIDGSGFVPLGGGDATMYHQLALSLLNGEGFSNVMFGLRPPLFPLLVAAIYRVAGKHTLIVMFFQMILGALSIALAYKIGYRLLRSQGTALIAGLLSAVEVAHLDATATMMSEPLHNFLLYVGLYWFVVLLQRGRWKALVAIAFAMGLAFLTRPATAQLPILLAVLAVVYRPRLWPYALAMLIGLAVPYTAWSLRNQYYTGSFTLSTTTSFTPLFYKSVAVESHATGRDPEEVAIDIKLELERRLGNDVSREEIEDYPVGRPEDLFASDPQRQKVSGQMVIERSLRYPVWSVIMTGVSLIRQFDVTRTDLPDWLQLGVMVIELVLALVGYRAVLGRWRDYSLFLLLSHAIVLYYAGLTAIALAGLYHTRFRTPYMPFILMYTALGILTLIAWVKSRRPGIQGFA